MMKPTPRSVAAQTVASVLSGRSLDTVLPKLEQPLSAGDRSLARALTYGVLREHLFLSALRDEMLKTPLVQDPLTAALIEVGLYQLRATRVSPHAAVSETVNACAVLELTGRRALVNALLRRYQRDSRTLEIAAASNPSRQYSYPTWLLDSIRLDWPDQWEQVLLEGNAQGPMCLRVNSKKTDRETYQALLKGAALNSSVVEGVADALSLENGVPVERLPDFQAGAVSVQDASAQLAVDLLAAEPGQLVLDACSAPGGKTAHILERADVRMIALDSDQFRLQRVQENLQRLGLEAELHCCDAGRFADRWDGPQFDRILLDAPCSGTGVIRRHPDIKYLRRHDDIPRMAAEQLRLLNALWGQLAPGGRLIFATCSILMAEGEEVIKSFFMRQADAKHEVIEAAWGEARRFGRRIPPGGAHDGFYYASLRKLAKKAK